MQNMFNTGRMSYYSAKRGGYIRLDHNNSFIIRTGRLHCSHPPHCYSYMHVLGGLRSSRRVGGNEFLMSAKSLIQFRDNNANNFNIPHDFNLNFQTIESPQRRRRRGIVIRWNQMEERTSEKCEMKDCGKGRRTRPTIEEEDLQSFD